MADEEKKAVPSGTSDNITPIERGDILEFQDVGKHADIGFDLFQQSHQYDPAQLERDATKVRKKLDFIVLPMVRMTPDPQTNIPNIMKLRSATDDDDIHVKFSRQTDVRVFPVVTRASLTGSRLNYSNAWILLTSMLWTRKEQPLRTSFWLSVNGVSSIIGALLSFGLGHVDNLAVPNWKLIYLVSKTTNFSGICLNLFTGRRSHHICLGFRNSPIPPRWPPQRQNAHRIRTSRSRLAGLQKPNWSQRP
jgi:hypothetical protein